MNSKANFDEMLQKQQLNLANLQQRLDEMKEEYQTYQRVLSDMKRGLFYRPKNEPPIRASDSS